MSEINLTSLSIYNMSGPPGLLLLFITPLELWTMPPLSYSSTYTLLGHLLYWDAANVSGRTR